LRSDGRTRGEKDGRVREEVHWIGRREAEESGRKW
jgi:hypothetical protein